MRNESTPHHFAISVSNLENSIEFYKVFGFRVCLEWEAADSSVRIAHLLQPDGYLLELFCYAKNATRTPLEHSVGNDLEDVGVKHLGFRVPDVFIAHQDFRRSHLGDITPIQHGRTGIDYFFVRDPNGIWVEVLQDDRQLNPDRPTYLSEEPTASD